MDESYLQKIFLYALPVCIVLVALLLYSMKPEPEEFTELYFNNHEEIPGFVRMGDSIEYSFSIANNELSTMSYDVEIETSYYNINYLCEKPVFYFYREGDYSHESLATGTTPNWRAEPKTPSTYIKENNYSLSYSYEVRSGKGEIATIFKGLEGDGDYIININHDEGFVNVDFPGTSTTAPIPEDMRLVNTLKIISSQGSTKIFLNGEEVLEAIGTPNGFLTFKSLNTYTKISGLKVDRSGVVQDFKVAYLGSETANIPLQRITVLEQHPSLLFSSGASFQGEESEVFEQDSIQSSTEQTYRYEGEGFSFPRYTLNLVFSGKDFILGIEDEFEVVFNSTHVIIGNEDFLLSDDKSGLHTLSVVSSPGHIKVFLDNTLVYEGSIVSSPVKKPFIRTTDQEFRIHSFFVESNTEPIIHNYVLERDITPIQRPVIYNEALLRKDVDQEGVVERIFQRNMVGWERYEVLVDFDDFEKNNTFQLFFNDLEKTIYSLEITGREAFLGYWDDNGFVHDEAYMDWEIPFSRTVRVNVANDYLAVNIDGRLVFEKTPVFTSNGVVLLNHSDELFVRKVEISSVDSYETRVLEVPVRPCELILVNSTLEEYSLEVPLNNKQSFSNEVAYNDEFDLAKTEVRLNNGQSILFWVMQI